MSWTVISALGVRSWSIGSNAITLVLVSALLSPVERGYYFTFLSLVMLQVFVDMGLSTVAVQFIGHEFSKLQWDERGDVHGDQTAAGRFRAIVRLTCRWYGFGSAAVFVVLLVGGFVVFGGGVSAPQGMGWLGPWLLYAATASLNLWWTPVIAAIEGSGRVAAANKLRLRAAVAGSLACWASLLADGGLYSVGLMQGSIAVVTFTQLWRGWPCLLRMATASTGPAPGPLDYRKEIWPMQWRIALSWMAGYFIYALYNPVVFRFHGAEAAGRMGLTLSLVNAVGALGGAWLGSSAPTFARLIAERRWSELDGTFRRVTVASTLFIVTLSVLAIGAFVLLRDQPLLHTRTLGLREIVFLLSGMLLNHLVVAYATYLRAYRQEPMLVMSLVGAAIMAGLIFTVGIQHGPAAMATFPLVVGALFGLPSAYWVWRDCRRRWNTNACAAGT